MKHRTNALRIALIALAGAAAATLGACSSDGNYSANMPNWNNNGPSDAGSSTAGPEGDASRPFDSDYDRSINGPFWQHL